MSYTLWAAPDATQLARRKLESGVVLAAKGFGEHMETHILKRTTDYSNWKPNAPIDNALFHPPAGIKFEEIIVPSPAKK